MNPGRLKLLAVVLALVALVSLAMNFGLLNRLHRTSAELEKLQSAHGQLARRLLEKERGSQSVYRAEPIEPLEPVSRPHPISKFDAVPSPPKEEVAEDDDFLRAAVQDMLALAIEEEFPELDLSDRELQELSEAVVRMRKSMQNLREFGRTSENVEVIRQLQDRRDQAMRDFEEITGMSAATFMLRAPGNVGIDNDESGDEEIHLEYLRDFRP